MDKENNLRVWLNRNGICLTVPVASTDIAKQIIRQAIKNDLKDDAITMNAFGLEIYEQNYDDTKLEWCEWYSKEGEDIMEIIDSEDDNNS